MVGGAYENEHSSLTLLASCSSHGGSSMTLCPVISIFYVDNLLGLTNFYVINSDKINVSELETQYALHHNRYT